MGMQEIKTVLCDIIDRAYRYEDKNTKNKYKGFQIELVPQKRKGFMGMYKPELKKIMVYNIDRSGQSILITALHELSHHILYMSGQEPCHDSSYFVTYGLLIHTAMDMQLLAEQDLLGFTESADAWWLEHFVKTYKPKKYDYCRNRYVIRVKVPYHMRRKASELGFHFSAMEKTWNKTVDAEEKESVLHSLRSFISEDDIEVSRMADIQFKSQIYITAVGNTAENISVLKENGFKYVGEGEWRKLVPISCCEEEMNRFENLGFSGLTFCKKPATREERVFNV